MQNSTQTDKALLFLTNQVFCVKMWKLWRTPTNLELNIFLLKLRTRFVLTNFYKRVFEGAGGILFRSWIVCKY